MKIHLSSDEINLLVYRYLIENGFVHTGFCFNTEANIPKNPLLSSQIDKIPPNALIALLQKALLYIYLEYHTADESGEEIRCEEPFSLFKKHECWCRPLEQESDVVSASPSATDYKDIELLSINEDTSSPLNNKNSAQAPPNKKGRRNTKISEVNIRSEKNLSEMDQSHNEVSRTEDLNFDVDNGDTSHANNEQYHGNSIKKICEDSIHRDTNINTYNMEYSSDRISNTLDESEDFNNECIDSFKIQEYVKSGQYLESNIVSTTDIDKSNCEPKSKNEANAHLSINKDNLDIIKGDTCDKEIALIKVNTELPLNNNNICIKYKDDINYKVRDDNSNNMIDVILSNNTSLVEKSSNICPLSDIPHCKLTRGNKKNIIREVQFSKDPNDSDKLVITWEKRCPELWDLSNIDNYITTKSMDNSAILLSVYKNCDYIAGTVVSMHYEYFAIGYENGGVTIFSYLGKHLFDILPDNEQSPIISLQLSISGTFLAIGDATGLIRIAEIKKDHLESTINTQIIFQYRHKSAVFGLCWCYDDRYLLSGCLNKDITLCNLNSKTVKVYSQKGQILSLKQTCGNQILCIMDGISDVPVFDIINSEDQPNLQCLFTLELTHSNIGADHIIPYLIVFAECCTIDNQNIYIVATSSTIYSLDSCGKILYSQVIVEQNENIAIVSIIISKDRYLIYTGTNDGCIICLTLPDLKIKTKMIENTECENTQAGVGTIRTNLTGTLLFHGTFQGPVIYFLNNLIK
ncbi:hypothetical protein cand_022610 [Cryptosporidium andersoni]|uniref:Anaphase-promoting complex subunit 4-like WD40 domain-containing protein n=1 Tax=Cryptosporidium andersoni TaxID=117008 RepID=A0A1J4MRV8_9CRYT|nr:hypothetical protein cand_022610 [Cryptosporidium andersoni]